MPCAAARGSVCGRWLFVLRIAGGVSGWRGVTALAESEKLAGRDREQAGGLRRGSAMLH